ncbi:MAG: TRAP transporter substrate-binding protein DctP [Geminicoccaceae bacterium]
MRRWATLDRITRLSFCWLSIAVLSSIFFAPASAQTLSWKIQSFQGADGIATQELEIFAKSLKERTDGRVEIEVLPAGTVVPNDETPRAINAGLIEGHYSSPSYFARLDPAFAILGDTLCAYPDPLARDGWFYDGDGLALARKLYAKNGLYFIGPVYWPADWMPSSLPLENVDDLDGLNIRSPGGLVGDLFKKAGADAVQLPAGQVHVALESGRIDATDWAHAAVNQASGLYDVAAYNVMLRHSMVLTEISVGIEAWDALTDDLKLVVEEAARAFSLHMQNVFAADEKQANDKLAGGGVVSIEWGKSESEAFRALLLDVWEDWRSRSVLAAEVIESHKRYMGTAGYH